MFRKCLFLVTVVLMAATIVFAQGTFKPRNADEEHAWRLYNQYKQSKQQVTQLEKGIKQTSGDIRSVSHGSLGALGASPEDAAALAKMRRQLAAENARQKNLEAAWHRKFYGRYRDLADGCSKTIYDAKTKRNMDGIEFGLRYFQFNVNNDGVYVPDKAVAVTPQPKGSSLFDGPWLTTKREHTDGCGYSAESDLTISTDATGVTRAINEALGNNKGKVVGRTLSLEYGIVNGIGTGTATFTLNEDGKSFSGTFSDKNGHRGKWSGKR